MQVLNVLSVFMLIISSLINIQATCVIAIKCTDGIAIGSDTQSSSGGSLIGNRETQKIFILTPNVVLCSAAGGRDVYKLQQDIKHEIRMHKLHYSTVLSVSAIATFARQLINNKYSSAHVIIVGILNDENIDDSNGDNSTGECKIYEIIPGGSFFEQEYAIAGSAASYLYPMLQGLCQTFLKSDNNNTINKSTDDKIFDPFISSSLRLPTEVAFSHLHTLLQSAITLDPKSGGQQCKWLLPLSTSRITTNTKKISYKKQLMKIKNRSNLAPSKKIKIVVD